VLKLIFILFLSLSYAQESSQDSKDEALRDAMAKMFSIERRVELLSYDLYKSENKIFLLKSDIKILKNYIKKEQNDLKNSNKAISKSLEELIKSKSMGSVEAIFSGKSLHESATQDKVSSMVHDNILLDAERKMLRIKFLESEERKLKTQEIELNKKLSVLNSKKRELVKIQKNKKQSLKKLLKDTSAAKNEFKKAYNMDLTDENFESLKSDLNSVFFEQEGQLLHPIDGKLVKSYGLWKSPRYRYKRLNKGNTYSPATANSKILAVYDGKVKYIGSIVQDKTVIIVDHGSKYYSVYQGKVTLKVKLGQKVKKGKILALANGPLYFEIRHYSDPVNLAKWLEAK